MAEERSSYLYMAIAAGIVAGIVVLLITATRPRPGPSIRPASLSEDEKAFLDQVVIADTQMSAAENFLGQTVTYLDAQITNEGARAVKQIELQLEFTDALGQVILRDRAYPVNAHTPPLKPGETRAFRVSFDRMPAEWNQAPPRISPTSIEF
jgi:hypothetical protein